MGTADFIFEIVYYNAPDTTGHFISKRNPGGAQVGWAIIVLNESIWCYLDTTGGAATPWMQTDVNTWNIVHFIVDRSDRAAWYRNGAYATSSSISHFSSYTLNTSGARLNIGNHENNSNATAAALGSVILWTGANWLDGYRYDDWVKDRVALYTGRYPDRAAIGGYTPEIVGTRADGADAWQEHWDSAGAEGRIYRVGRDEPRFVERIDDNGAFIHGMLFEAAVENLIKYSGDINSWTKSGATVTDTTSVVLPDGTDSGYDILHETSGGTFHYVQSNYYTVDNTKYYIGSIWSRMINRNWICLQLADGDASGAALAYFNLLTGAKGTTGGAIAVYDYNIEYWGPPCKFRTWIVFTPDQSGSNAYFSVFGAYANGDRTYSGQDQDDYYCWGAMVHEGLYPSSYIATGSDQLTRETDSVYRMIAKCNIGGASNGEGTVIFAYLASPLAPSADIDILEISDEGASGDRLLISAASSTGNAKFTSAASGGDPGLISGSTDLWDRAIHVVQLSYKTNTVKLWVDGVLQGTDSDVDIPANLTRIDVKVPTEGWHVVQPPTAWGYYMDSPVYPWPLTTGVIPRALEDTITLTGSVVRAHDAARIIDAAISISDSVDRERVRERTVSDSITITDSVAVELEYARSHTDSVAITDSVERVHDAVRTVSDTLTLTDSAAYEVQFFREISDSLTLTDSVERIVDWVRIISDSLVLSDDVLAEKGGLYERSASASISITDDTDRVVDWVRIISDALVLTDSVSTEKFGLFERSASDSISVTDSVSVELTYERSTSAAVVLSDSVDLELAYGRTITDSVVLSDSVETAQDVNVVLSDSLAISDSAETSLSYARESTDALVLSDSVETALAYAREITDSIVIADSASWQRDLARTVSTSITITDSVSRIVDWVRILSDAIVIGDSVEVEIAGFFQREITDSIVLDDSVFRTVDWVRILSDSIVIGDSVSRGLELSGSASDTVTLTDSVETALSYLRDISDTISITDSVQAVTDVEVVLSDTISLTDSVSVETDYVREASDAVVLSDAAETALSYLREASDSIVVTDSVSRVLATDVIVSDTITLTDSVSVELTFERTVTDSIALTDEVSTASAWNIVLADSLELTDSAFTSSAWAFVLATDAISITDSVAAILEVGIVASDTITLALVVVDSVAPALDMLREASDSLIISDAVATALVYAREATDSLVLIDQISRETSYGGLIRRAVSDVIAITDLLIAETAYHRIITDSLVIVDLAEADFGDVGPTRFDLDVPIVSDEFDIETVVNSYDLVIVCVLPTGDY
jgi:hypothetical protein